jgi:multiple sugar transport system substrate-binding protein
MSRLTAWLLLLAVTGLVMSGCRGAGSGKTVLRVSSWGGAGDDSEFWRITREVYDEFERQNPDIELQLEMIPGSQEYAQKLLLSFVARSEPDVIALDASSSAAFVNSGVLLDLAPLASSDSEIDLVEFFPNVVDIARRGDEVFAVPLDFTPVVMYCNMRLFDEAGVPYPEPGWTWDDFLDKAQKLTKGDQYGFKFTNWMPGWVLWIWNGGSEVLNAEGDKASGTFNSSQNQETIQFLADLIEVHKAAPSLSQSAALGVDPFVDGLAAMEISGHWAMIGYSQSKAFTTDDILVVPMPTRDGSEPTTVMYEKGLAIGKNSKHKDEAWRFIKYMSSAEVQRKIQSTGLAVSARKDVTAERSTNDIERAFESIIPSARVPGGSITEGYSVVEMEGERAMDAVLKSGKTPKQALDIAAEAIDRYLEDH